MWFMYALSWLALLIQAAFVTLGIGEAPSRSRCAQALPAPEWCRLDAASLASPAPFSGVGSPARPPGPAPSPTSERDWLLLL